MDTSISYSASVFIYIARLSSVDSDQHTGVLFWFQAHKPKFKHIVSSEEGVGEIWPALLCAMKQSVPYSKVY